MSTRPTRSSASASADGSTRAFTCGGPARAESTASAPSPASTAAATGSGGRARKAIPRAMVSRMGKPKVQKTDEGSRKKMSTRARVRRHRELIQKRRSLTELPPGEGQEHVVERGLVRGEARQRRPPRLEQVEQGRDRLVHPVGGEGPGFAGPARRVHPRQRL